MLVLKLEIIDKEMHAPAMHQLHISSGASGWCQASAAAILLGCALALEAKEVERTGGSVVVGSKQETRRSGTAAQKRVAIDAKLSEAFGNLVVFLTRKKCSYTAELNPELL